MRHALLITAAALAACGEAPQPANNSVSSAIISDVPGYQPPANIAGAPSPIERARAALKRDPKVVDFLLDPANAVMLQVAVRSNGSREYGLAETYCMDLKDWGFDKNEAAVRIVDAARVQASNGDFRSISLGTVRCRDTTRLD
ncbi:hypothetical protein N6H05_01755 [Sphingobium sp. WTD-1]|uniref:hypothetical protein n=1 Tax=Sphingobium sp. WTD-1 TaxID=2979467 RepID=UPI0024DE0F63|nr:hypothetical protein [Sphingobium sp. WTD-1]WIA56575.1 hypothetical protein N6H05_01755 [Sphingobium sp. WTD-1]